MNVLAIYGSGGLGIEIAQTVQDIEAQHSDWEKTVFVDDVSIKKSVNGIPILPYSKFKTQFSTYDAEIVIGVGEPKSRHKLMEIIETDGYQLARIIHPSASVSEYSTIGPGAVVQYGARVAPDAYIGKNTVLNSHSSIGHNCVVGDGCVISSFVPVGGGAKIGNNTFVGMGAIIRDHISIGSDCIISMGAVVFKDIKDGMLAMGNPARSLMTTKEGVFH